MKVIIDGIIYQEQARGGISRLYKEILPMMCDMDDSLHIKFLSPKKPKQSFPQHSHITYCSLPKIENYLRPSRLWSPLMPKAKQMAQRFCIGDGKNQIWHSTHFTMPDIWKGLQIITVYDMIYERCDYLFSTWWDEQFRKQKKFCIQKAHIFICISDTTSQDLQRFYDIDSSSIYVIHLAYSDDIFKQLKNSFEISINQPFLLYVGDRNHYKNFNRLIDTYSKWKYKEDIALVVVGQPWKMDESYRIDRLGIQNNVHLLTEISDNKLCQLYNQAAAFVYPSLYEGFGIPLLEAMACGCPIIASRIPSTIEVAGDCPIYFEPTENDDLINAFDIAISEGKNSERVKNGLKKVTFYSWKKTAEQTLEVYRLLS